MPMRTLWLTFASSRSAPCPIFRAMPPSSMRTDMQPPAHASRTTGDHQDRNFAV